MLNINQIKKAIEDNEIRIYYSFIKNEKGKIERLQNEKTFSELPEFSDYLYSDRLKVTLGPVLKILSNKKVDSKYRFKNIDFCYDMSKSSDTFVLNPHQSIIILTNERIELDGKHSVLIIPRVSLSEVGIIVAPAYIDPYYNGLLRLNVSNNSDTPYELKTLEVIAQCFFFDSVDEVDMSYKNEFSQKSAFVGQNWKSIFNEDRAPFPVKKSKKYTIPILYTIKKMIVSIFNFLNKYALLTTMFTVISVLVINYLNFNTYKENTDKIMSNFASDSTEIRIEAGETYGKQEITVKCKKDEILSVICNNDDIKYEIKSTNDDQKVEIIFKYFLESPSSSEYKVDFSYTVVKRID